MIKTDIEIAFSKARVARFCTNIKDDLVFDNYTRSQLISNNLYLPLSVFEITLRNKITNELGNSWYNLMGVSKWKKLLKKKGLKIKKYSEDELKTLAYLSREIRNGKKGSFPTFGFYTSFFTEENKTLFTKTLLTDFFPKENGKKYRLKAQSEFDEIRRIRNRVAHLKNLTRKYSQKELLYIVEMIYDYVTLLNKPGAQWLDRVQPKEILEKQITDLYEQQRIQSN